MSNQKHESDAIYDIDPEYPLVAGEWEVLVKDEVTDNVAVMSFEIMQMIRLKELHTGGLKILKAWRVR